MMMKRLFASTTIYAAEATGVAVLWCMLFTLNIWWFTGLEYRDNVNWIFLPAAIRVLAVLLFGWRAVAGLFAGALLTSTLLSTQGLQAIEVAALSALSPWVAVTLLSRLLNLSQDLQGLSFEQLTILSFAGAGLSAFAHTLHFSFHADDKHRMWDFFPMFAGDLVGTTLVLYAAHFAMRFWWRRRPDNRL